MFDIVCKKMKNDLGSHVCWFLLDIFLFDFIIFQGYNFLVLSEMLYGIYIICDNLSFM